MISFTTGHALFDDEESEADQHVQGPSVGYQQAELLYEERSQPKQLQQEEEEEEEEETEKELEVQCGGLHRR